MRSIIHNIFLPVRAAVALTATCVLLFGVLYPALITLSAQSLFLDKAKGSFVVENETIRGSRLLGQHFTDKKYFWGRPSATQPPYNAAGSGGSNVGTGNPALIEAVKERAAALRAADKNNTAPIPIDLVTASASGLDPHISPEAAQYQAERVARARGMEVAKITALIEAHTEPPQFGVFGQRRVNVLLLNRALDGSDK